MTILLFILTAVLVGYVVYTFYSSDAGQATNNRPDPKPAAAENPPARAAKKSTTASAETGATGSESLGTSEPFPAQYCNPETGETAAVPTNYRFAKRWIKEALVAEGLLDKVYKTSELNGQAIEKVKAALDKFKAIKKYHA